jgi:hypothetical protein
MRYLKFLIYAQKSKFSNQKNYNKIIRTYFEMQ